MATHQALDLNAVYRPFTKLTITLDGEDTAAKVQHALAVATAPRMGPVHIAVPSDVAREAERATGAFEPGAVPTDRLPPTPNAWRRSRTRSPARGGR